MNIHDGGRFVDFNGRDINGQYHSFSKIIKSNKIILLDFWSTWCAPCIETSRNLITVYNEYKRKGFEIVGITQCDSKLNNIEGFIRKEQYPWDNLIDYDGKEGIWDKYNLSNQGGGLFLVNASGKIIAVNPSVDNIKKKLIEELK